MTDQEEKSSGNLLRAARIQAGFPTIRAFADHLSTLGLIYTDEAVGHWENDRRVPPREVLLQVLGVLTATGGFENIGEINRMLWRLGWRDLSAEEIATHFSPLSPGMLPDNLPACPYDQLVGRQTLVDRLADHLSGPSEKAVVVLSGLGGIGKTAVAYEVAARMMLSGQFERLAWEGTRSEEFIGVARRIRQSQELNWPAILTSITRQLELDHLLALPVEALEQQLHSMLHTGRYLVVLDNLESLDAAREVARALHHLVSSSASTRVLITSRERLVDEPYVRDYFIGGLDKPATLELLAVEARIRGADALLAAGEDLQERIFTITGGMPLAIKLIVSQHLLGIALDVELERLQQAADEEELYRFIYFSLWEKLGEDARKILVGLAAFATSAQEEMLQQVSQVEGEPFRRAVAELVKASLLQVAYHTLSDSQRYGIHALTRWFVNAPLAEMWHRQQTGH